MRMRLMCKCSWCASRRRGEAGDEDAILQDGAYVQVDRWSEVQVAVVHEYREMRSGS
jgi:hypothetical protein